MTSLALGAALLPALLPAEAPAQHEAVADAPPIALPPPKPTGSNLGNLVRNDELLVVVRRRPMKPLAVNGGRVVVNAVGAFEPGYEQKRLLGLRVDVAPGKGEGRSAYLDLHEVDTLIRAMGTLQEVARDPITGLVTEADFRTKEGLLVGAISEEAGIRHTIRIVRPEDGEEKPAPLTMSRSTFATLRRLLDDARQALFE